MTKKIILSYDPTTENFAEVGMDAWIEANGGVDVTYRLPNPDHGAWVGDWQADNGTVYRLLVNGKTGEIDAYELEVRFELDEPIRHGGEHIWSGAEWLAETRDEDRIRADILADLYEDTDGEFITVLGEAF